MSNPSGVIALSLLIIFGALFFGAWIYALVDCLRSEFRRSGDKIAWLLVVILLPILGSFLYLVLSHKQKLLRRVRSASARA